jgi:hypothetical protein
MRVEIKEGYDIVLTAETDQDRRRLARLNDKYISCGLRAEMVGGPGLSHSITVRPVGPQDDNPVVEVGG